MSPLYSALFVLLSQSSPVLTVDQAVDIAVKNAFAIRTSQVNEARTQDLVDLAKAGAGLNVNVQGGYTRIEQRDVKKSTFGGGFGPQKDTATFSFNVSQVVDVSGAVRRAVSQARFNRQAANLTTESQVNAIKNLTRQFCFAILQTQEAVVIQKDEVRAAKERLEKSQVRFRNDAVPRFDVLRFETDLRRAEQNLVDATQNAVLAKQQLNNLLGREIDTPFELTAIPEKPALAATPEDLTALALKARPDIRAAETSLKGLKEALGREKLGLAPQVVLSASHSETLTQISPGSSKGQTVGALSVTLPIFDSGITRSKVRSAEKDIEQASILLEQARLGAALEVRSSLTRLSTAEESYQTAIKTEELARESLRLAQLRYDEGVGIVVDVTTAQAQLTAARSSLVNARYAFLAAYAELQQAVGRDDLTPLAKETSK